MSILRKREVKHPGMVRDYPKARGFYKPQRAHIKQPMPAHDAPLEMRKAA
jgi:hypothetical protein